MSEADAEEVQQMIDTLKDQICSKAGKEFSELKVVNHIAQCLNGTIFFVKVNVGGDDYIHVKIYKAGEMEPEVHNVQLDKSADDSLICKSIYK